MPKKERQPTYGHDDYLADMKVLEASGLTGSRLAAQRTAIYKRYKAGIVLDNLYRIVDRENLDLTPTMAAHIVRVWIGRSISRELLNQHFAEPGRTAADKSVDFVRAERIAQEYRDAVLQDLAQIPT